MIVIGLTGSIGMGKTTTAKLFAEEGVPVLDSDEVVHGLYRAEAVAQIEAAFPGTTVSGVVDREKLGDILRKNPANFRRLEEIVHPLVRKNRKPFCRKQGKTAGNLRFWIFRCCSKRVRKNVSIKSLW